MVHISDTDDCNNITQQTVDYNIPTIVVYIILDLEKKLNGFFFQVSLTCQDKKTHDFH